MKIRIRGQKPQAEKIIEAWLEPHGDGIELRMSVDGHGGQGRILTLTVEGVSLFPAVTPNLGIALDGDGRVVRMP